MGNSSSSPRKSDFFSAVSTSIDQQHVELDPIPEGLPVQEVSVTTANEELLASLDVSGPLLVVTFSLNNTQWTVHRTPGQFWKLHFKLYVVNLAHPGKPEVAWHHFLIKPRHAVSETECVQFKEYLIWILANPRTRSTEAFGEFCEVSAVSFLQTSHSGKGIMEGYAQKRRGGRRFMLRGCSAPTGGFANLFKPKFSKRWFVLKKDYLMYTEGRTSQTVRDVLLFDCQFSAELISPRDGGKGTALPARLRSGSVKDTRFIKIQNGYRKIVLAFDSHLRALEWLHAIRAAHAESEWNRHHRFDSFAPPREKGAAKLLVDGHAYMSELLKHLAKARSEVYISGWWLVPDLPLTRPGVRDTVLDVLKNRAENGVKVFIVLYKELTLALTLDSWFTKQMLEAAHPNIRVILHPKQIGIRAVLAWSHHQKLVIIDHEVAFVGGLDLCLGRYDTKAHRLCDSERPFTFPGKDYCNPCIKDLVDVRAPMHNDSSLEDRASQPRLAWHDVQCMLKGAVVGDLVRHYVQLWNHVKTDKHRREDGVTYLEVREVQPKPIVDKSVRAKIKTITNKFTHWRKRKSEDQQSSLRNIVVTDEDIDGDALSVSSGEGAEEDTRQMFSINEDQQAEITGATSLLMGRSVTMNTAPEPVSSIPSPAGKRQLSLSSLFSAREGSNRTRNDLSFGDVVRSVTDDGVSLSSAALSTDDEEGVCHIQLLRSASWWSIGLPTDSSILKAYCSLITNAKKYVYIENQFFITTAPSKDGEHVCLPAPAYGGDGAVRNLIGRAIATRIVAAYLAGESFKVYIVLPVMPAFENAQLLHASGFVTRVTLQLQFQSLTRGRDSILGFILAAMDGDDKLARELFDTHICISGLRQVDVWPDGRILTEQLYVHSKVMVVDDQFTVIGSANINDRSMLGDRDSEIAVLVENETFATNTRMELWKEHFGVIDNWTQTGLRLASDDILVRDKICKTILDPCADACFDLWKRTGTANAEIYHRVFGVVPCNQVKSRKEFERRMNDNFVRGAISVTNQDAMDQIEQLTGRIVEFQLDFLEHEDNLYDPMPTTASLCPREIFS